MLIQFVIEVYGNSDVQTSKLYADYKINVINTAVSYYSTMFEIKDIIERYDGAHPFDLTFARLRFMNFKAVSRSPKKTKLS